MPRTSKRFLKAAATACAAKVNKSTKQTQKESKGPTIEVLDSDLDGNLDHMDIEDRCWRAQNSCKV